MRSAVCRITAVWCDKLERRPRAVFIAVQSWGIVGLVWVSCIRLNWPCYAAPVAAPTDAPVAVTVAPMAPSAVEPGPAPPLPPASGAPGGDTTAPVCTEETHWRCEGEPRRGWNNFGATDGAANCASECSSRPRCTYVVYHVRTQSCTAFEMCAALSGGGGPWQICAVRGPPVELPAREFAAEPFVGGECVNANGDMFGSVNKELRCTQMHCRGQGGMGACRVAAASCADAIAFEWHDGRSWCYVNGEGGPPTCPLVGQRCWFGNAVVGALDGFEASDNAHYAAGPAMGSNNESMDHECFPRMRRVPIAAPTAAPTVASPPVQCPFRIGRSLQSGEPIKGTSDGCALVVCVGGTAKRCMLQ
eukprot:gene16380-biopygen73025